MDGRTLIIAHRGASSDAAENSLEAFERAIALGADMIEFDVRRTAEGALVVFHDARVGGLLVSGLTVEELARRAGAAPPLLAEVLELARGRIGVDVEVKEDGYVEDVAAALRDGIPVEQVVVTSFLDGVVGQMRAALPGARTGLLVGLERRAAVERRDERRRSGPGRPRGGSGRGERLGAGGGLEGRRSSPVVRARACGADFVAPHHTLARLGVLARAAAVGMPALVWTVNRRDQLRALLRDERVAGVITDHPARGLALRDGDQP